MANLIQLTDDYGYNAFKISNIQSTVIDASDATWIVSNMGDDLNLYPVVISGGEGVTLIGGTITGEVPLDLDWLDAYVNSAAVFVRSTDGAVIEDWTITQAWDGIRVRGSDDFVIDGVYMRDIRDDAIENDDGLSGTVRDCLFDGVFVGISTSESGSANNSRNVVTFDDVLVRMESFSFKGVVTHQSPFKVTGASPSMKIYDSVFAIENVNHIGQERLKIAWDKVIDASGNYFLNLSDKPLPGSYPMPPKGFTVLQGSEARAFWEAARAEWISEHADTEPVPEATHVGTDGNDTLDGTSGDDVMLGGAGNDVLFGYDGNDVLRGQNGDDTLVGRRGTDVMIGGTGQDMFRFASVSDYRPDSPDIIRAGDGAIAFEGAGVAGGDRIDFGAVDANWNAGGNQAFVFGSTNRGGISLVNGADSNTLVRGNTDGDAAFEFVIVIEDGDTSAANYRAIDFML